MHAHHWPASPRHVRTQATGLTSAHRMSSTTHLPPPELHVHALLVPVSSVQAPEQGRQLRVLSLATEKGTERHRDLACTLPLDLLFPEGKALPYAQAREVFHGLGERRRYAEVWSSPCRPLPGHQVGACFRQLPGWRGLRGWVAGTYWCIIACSNACVRLLNSWI